MDTARLLRAHVETLASDIGERHVGRPAALDRAATHIATSLERLNYAVRSQQFEAAGVKVRNVEAELAGRSAAGDILVVGAHYDSVPGCPGANDNGSGVAGLLELARRFAARPMSRTIRFVGFVNEEPPFFMSGEMGSLVYANGASRRRENIVGMLSLETIGYYAYEPGSQQYPGGLPSSYPDTGNFIGLVANEASAPLLDRARRAFSARTSFPMQAAAAPEELPGVGWSDHWSFWQAGYQALMVTDTAPFRYPWYHTGGDTPDKLDYAALAEVVNGLEEVVRELAGGS